MGKLRVLIVDQSLPDRKILSQAVEKTGLGHVEYATRNGNLVLERLSQGGTDVVLLEMLMPNVNYAEILEAIQREHPGVFVVALGNSIDADLQGVKGYDQVKFDFIQKPPLTDSEKIIENLKNQMQGVFAQIMTQKYTAPGTMPVNEQTVIVLGSSRTPLLKHSPEKHFGGANLIVIAASTGGTSALETICKGLPSVFDKPILVVQHMPAELTKKLAQSLDKKCKLPVVEAEEGETVKPGHVMIAPGGCHMTVEAEKNSSRILIKLKTTMPVNGVRPAADVLFQSVAEAYRGKRVLAIILTGMGSDGAMGVKEMKAVCECYCIAQSEKTCTVYGMPKSVVEAGLSDAVKDLDLIASHMLQLV